MTTTEEIRKIGTTIALSTKLHLRRFYSLFGRYEMTKFGIKMSFLLVAVLLSFSGLAFAGNVLLYENFDDQRLDSRFTVYGANWTVVSPPGYNLESVGRNGAGYCFSSGTVAAAHLCWMNNIPNPWPSDEMYVSFWMRYPKYEHTDANENFKIFYPHWNGTASYVHYSMIGSNTIYYSARANGVMISISNWINCPNQTDGNWHRYEFYIKFSEGISRFWYDGTLKINHTYGKGYWLPNNVYYISAPSIDAEEPGIFSRQVDDWEVWNGMPSGLTITATPAAPGTSNPATFTFSATSGSGTITAYSWDFGDGSTSTAATPKHSYSTSGDKVVRLTVTINGVNVQTSQTIRLPRIPQLSID